jgi:hypothetical protein
MSLKAIMGIVQEFFRGIPALFCSAFGNPDAVLNDCVSHGAGCARRVLG